jgi:hypothetical protein
VSEDETRRDEARRGEINHVYDESKVGNMALGGIPGYLMWSEFSKTEQDVVRKRLRSSP